MVFLYSALIFFVALLVGINFAQFWSLRKARRSGKLPIKGKATMFDVRHLLMEGEKELAIKVFCSIFNTTSAQARKEVEQLERSLKV